MTQCMHCPGQCQILVVYGTAATNVHVVRLGLSILSTDIDVALHDVIDLRE